MNPPLPTAEDNVIVPLLYDEKMPVPAVYPEPLTLMNTGVCDTVKILFESLIVPTGVSAVRVAPLPPPLPGCIISTTTLF